MLTVPAVMLPPTVIAPEDTMETVEDDPALSVPPIVEGPTLAVRLAVPPNVPL